MRGATAIGAVALSWAATAALPEPGADPGDVPVHECLVCHVDRSGMLDIVGLAALESLPQEWSFLFEDSFDLDGDGVAGRIRFVSTPEGPKVAKFGKALAAATFEDFAKIAAAVHAVPIAGPGVMARLRAAFLARSPDPGLPFPDAAAQARFEDRGCASCHVTRSFEHNGRTYQPLSDFLLHDLGDGPRRTQPLWGCPECLLAAPHAVWPDLP